MNVTRLNKLSELVTNNLKRKPIIIVEPNNEISLKGTAHDLYIGYDADKWNISDETDKFISELANSDESVEEKIVQVYKELCMRYEYDDNVLSYIKKNEDDSFFLPDEYGRKPNESWKEKRKGHKRRTCYEISRILAKSIIKVIKQSGESKNCDVCILWDEAVTHYLVGLAHNEYYATLDLDDFLQIKDLTRLKTDLTLEGIKILEDPKEILKSAVDKYNSEKNKSAKDNIEKRTEKEELEEIEFLKYSIEVLKDEYHLDSAGIFEYMKEIVDTKFGVRAREKVWKEVPNTSGVGKRYTRCMVVKIDDEDYVIDVTQNETSKVIRSMDEYNKDETDELKGNLIQFKNMSRNWKDDPYDGR